MEKLKKIFIPVLVILILGIIFLGVVFFMKKEKEKYYVTEYDVSELNPCISRQYSDNTVFYLSSDLQTDELLLKSVNFSDSEIKTVNIQEPVFAYEKNDKELFEAGAPYSKEAFQGYMCVDNERFLFYICILFWETPLILIYPMSKVNICYIPIIGMVKYKAKI